MDIVKLLKRCRSPCGERGLKSESHERRIKNEGSLPVRGAWVEINDMWRNAVHDKSSLPVRGAWVEILAGGIRESTG